jgi:hypothetical protein
MATLNLSWSANDSKPAKPTSPKLYLFLDLGARGNIPATEILISALPLIAWQSNAKML